MKRGVFGVVSFMIYLIVLLPVYSSSAYAAFNKIESYGEDIIPNVRKSQDATYLSVEVTPFGGTEVIPANFDVNGVTSEWICDLLDPTAKKYSCETILEGRLETGTKEYSINYVAGEGDSGHAKFSMIVDDGNPKISKFYAYVNDSKVAVDYDLYDLVSKTAQPGTCGGLARLRFLASGAQVHLEEFENKTLCRQTGSSLFVVPVSGVETKEICMEAYDVLGHKDSECMDVEIDLAPPIDEGFKLTKGTQDVDFIGPKPLSGVSLKIFFKEDGEINKSGVYADLRNLNDNPTIKPQYENRTPDSCGEDNTKKYCLWNNLNIYLTSSSPSFSVHISDMAGNTAEYSYTAPIIVDSSVPTVTSITTDHMTSDGRNWVNMFSNDIIVNINDEGSGFSKKFIGLELSAFGGQNVVASESSNYMLRANECKDDWTCVWENVVVSDFPLSGNEDSKQGDIRNLTESQLIKYLDFDDIVEYDNTTDLFFFKLDAEVDENNLPVESGSLLPILIAYPSSDDSGNLVEGQTIGGAYFDGIPPVIMAEELVSKCPTSSDRFEWNLYVKDDDSGEPIINYDTSEMTLSGSNISTECFIDGEYWKCPVVIDGLPSYAIDEADIPVIVNDRAGNAIKTSFHELRDEYARVCELVDGVPDFIKIDKVKFLTPAGEEEGLAIIDRKIASQIPYPVMMQLTLKGLNDKVEVLNTQVLGCQITYDGNSIGDISDVYNMYENAPEKPFINTRVSFKKPPAPAPQQAEGEPSLEGETAPAPVNPLVDINISDFSCNLSFMIRAGTKLYKEPEVEGFSEEVRLGNLPVGYINDSIKQKLTNLRDDIKGLEKEIKKRDKWNKALGTICNIGLIGVVIVEIMTTLEGIIFGVSSVLYAIPFTKAAGEELGKWTSFVVKLVISLVNLFIWNPPGYGLSPIWSTGIYFRLLCSFYTCKLFDAKKFINIVPIVASTSTFSLGPIHKKAKDEGLFKGKMSGGTSTYKSVSLGKWDAGWEEKSGIVLSGEGSTEMNMNEDGTEINLSNTKWPDGDHGFTSGDAKKMFDRQKVIETIPITSMFNKYDWNPYRSIKTAESMMCMPAILYNKKKLRQIKCLQYRCYATRGINGMDTSICDEQYKVRECIYYDGAAYKTMDDWNTVSKIWKNYNALLWGELTVLASAIGAKSACTVCTDPMNQLGGKVGGIGKINPFLMGIFPSVGIAAFVGQTLPATIHYDYFASFSNECVKTNPASWFRGLGCDITVGLTFGIDTGEWITYDGLSADVAGVFNEPNDPDFCEGIEDLE